MKLTQVKSLLCKLALAFLHSLMMREVWLPTEARKDYQTGILDWAMYSIHI